MIKKKVTDKVEAESSPATKDAYAIACQVVEKLRVESTEATVKEALQALWAMEEERKKCCCSVEKQEKSKLNKD